MTLVHRDTISRVFWEPYIVKGYRKTDISLWQCFKYAFTLHNDVGNFWTHFVPAIAWMVWLYYLSFSLDLTDPYWYPLVVLWVGGSCYTFCSSLAHFLACKSLKTRQVAFMVDYMGISLYGTGGFIAYFFYERRIGFVLFDYKWSFIATVVLVNSTATLTCSLSRFFWEKYRYYARSGSYFLPYVLGLFPFLTRFFGCVLTGEQCVYETLHLHVICFFLSLVLLFFFVTKIPERFFPGSFDIFFHSHQLFHVSSVAMTTMQFYFILHDSSLRRDHLSTDPYLLPDISSTLFPFLAVMLLSLTVIGVLGHLVFTSALISNKLNHSKKN